MEVEVRKYKGVILDLEGVTVTKSSFDKPRIAYYRVKYDNLLITSQDGETNFYGTTEIIYIAFASKNDLKQVDLLNAKITELRNEKDSIQDKIDIQNKLYADTIKEKDNYIEQRKQLYIENTNVNIQENTIKTTHVQDLAKIHKIAKQYEGSEIMKKLSQTIEKYVDRLLENTGKNEKDVVEKEDEAEA